MNNVRLGRRASLVCTASLGAFLDAPFSASRALAQGATECPSRGPIKAVVPGPPGCAMDNLLCIVQPAPQ